MNAIKEFNTEGAPRPVNASDSAMAADDPRVVRALEEYAAAATAGKKPNRQEFEGRYPEIATALAECLDGLEFVQAAAPQLAHPAGRTADRSVAAEFWPADALGDYRIVREVGRGGMGVVYEVMQLSLGRRVALKVLPFASALDAKQLQRFKNEAQAAAQLHHQNIVPVYGVGSERGVHYYAMQFIDGQTLSALIGELRLLAGFKPEEAIAETFALASLAGELVSGRWAPMSPAGDSGQHDRLAEAAPSATATVAERGGQAGATVKTPARSSVVTATDRPTKGSAFFRTVANLGVQAAEALEHAHAAGVVHRDVKPANLLLDSRGHLWVTDFGLAHCQSQAGLTMTGDMMGTLRYMSPEQALAQRVLLDHRTDIYSLGATLYELLTLAPVFDGRDRQELLRQIASDEPRRPRAWNDAIPSELETIVLKAMEKNPADRYATAQDLADDLGRYLRDEPIRARPARLIHKLKKWMRRHSAAVWTATAMLALMLVTVTVGALLAAWRLNGERDATRDQLRLTQQAEVEAARRLYRSQVEQARANRLTHRMGQRFKSLDILAEATQRARAMDLPEEDMLELRNEVIACLALPDLRIAKEWSGWPAGSLTLDVDNALERYARIDRQGVVSVCRVGTGELLWRLTAFGPGNFGPGEETWPLFSPNGRFLLLARGGRLKLWDLGQAGPVVTAELADVATIGVFSPDNHLFAVGRPDGSVDIHELPGGAKVMQLTRVQSGPSLRFDPSARRLAVAGDAGIDIHNVSDGNLLTTLPGRIGDGQIVWHPNGDRLASAIGPTVVIWNVSTGAQTARLEGHKDGGLALAYNHSGDLLATCGWDEVLRLWDPRSGKLLFNTRAGMRTMCFGADDHRLGIGIHDDMLQLWELGSPRGYRTLMRDTNERDCHSCAASPRLPLLAVGMGSGVGLWHLTTGAPLVFIPQAGYRMALFEPSGALLTDGAEGLRRWPVREEPAGSGKVIVGPPQKLPVSGSGAGHLAISADNRVIACADLGGGQVWRHDRTAPLRLSPHQDCRYIGVSADGRWVATGSHWATKVKIWDATTGQLSSELPIENGSDVAFSPDGKWLATTGDGGQLWAVDSWRAGPKLGGVGRVAFSPDGSLLAASDGHDAIRLLDPVTGREFARLQDPEQDVALWICFSSDGAQLAVTSSASQSIHVWDLRTIRTELAQMGLDWDLPAYPPAPAIDERPLQIEVDRGEPTPP